MKTRLRSVAFIAVFMFGISAGLLEAQDGFAVDMDVACDDVELRSLVRSFFSRDLRDLGDDVRVGESGNPDYQLEVVAEKVGSHGWVMSAVISDLYNAADAGESMEGYGKTIVHSLTRGDGSDDLGREIGLIVKGFDRDVLKPIRKERKKK
jgi:hypothetical protein